ncbi:antitoxin of toxin-antitoxin stability system [Endozoicomonas sp. ALB032]|uniref:antitoxin of toxin-antitoxin stability system n=1 Tax=Endozoicomonas sp. ALB032 TaxID=3403082 RepID=UPI003BB6F74D
MKIDSELRADFIAESEAIHRPASQVVRELMREFIERQKKAREYDEYLQDKVNAGRKSMNAGDGCDNHEIEAEFAALRANAANRS